MADLLLPVRRGSDSGLYCLRCGDPCTAPSAHLATDRNATSLLSPDAPCRNYAEVEKWGRRWRVIEAYAGGGVRFFVDDMGPEIAFHARPFSIPSMGGGPEDWNVTGECAEIARDRHGAKPYERKIVPRATGADWAERYVRQNEIVAALVQGRSTFGPAFHVQRSKDWIR